MIRSSRTHCSSVRSRTWSERRAHSGTLVGSGRARSSAWSRLQAVLDPLADPPDRALRAAQPVGDLRGRVALKAQLDDLALGALEAPQQALDGLGQHGRLQRRRLAVDRLPPALLAASGEPAARPRGRGRGTRPAGIRASGSTSAAVMTASRPQRLVPVGQPSNRPSPWPAKKLLKADWTTPSTSTSVGARSRTGRRPARPAGG